MQSCEAKIDQRFPVQQISETTWLRATAANAAADYSHGFRGVVDDFLSRRPQWHSFWENLRAASPDALTRLAGTRRAESLAFLVLMLTGVCNADCEICFTDRKRKPRELTPDERDVLLTQAKGLGAQYCYVPGEGEPTLDKGWWQFVETCSDLDLPAIVFTNGMIFGDPDLSRRTWGMSPEDAVRRLADHPVHFYSKYWTPDAALAAKMLAVPVARLPYGEVDGVPVPLGLQNLMENLPRERVGVEVVIERRNAGDVVDTIAPFAQKHGLASIVELIQHNGRTFGDPSYDPTAAQADAITSLLSPTSCTLATCKAVVTVQGYVSPRIAVMENQLPDDRRRVVGADLYQLLHETPYIVDRRYDLSCLCESIPAELAGDGAELRGTYNVTPPALASAVAPQAPAAAEVGGCSTGGCLTCTGGCLSHG
jgi:hypothetical protein